MIQQTSKKLRKLLYDLLIFVFCIIIVVCLVKIIQWYINNKKNKEIKEEISQHITYNYNKNVTDYKKQYEVDFKALKEINNEVKAWLKVNGTNVEYTVVQGTNNEYYLKHNFNKEYNVAGWIFADYRNKFDGTDKNIIIYGHNMKDDNMFGSLKKVTEEEWYNNEENYKIFLATENEISEYYVFSVYQIEDEEYYIQTDFENNIMFGNFIKTIKERSLKDFNIEVTENDNILTLSTCANNNKYRIVLHAKKMAS